MSHRAPQTSAAPPFFGEPFRRRPMFVAFAGAAILVACGDNKSATESDDTTGADAADTGGETAADVPADEGRPDVPLEDTGRDTTVDVPDRETVQDVADGETQPEDTSDTGDVVENQPPVAVAGEDQSGVPGVPLSFDGSASTDPDGRIVSWEWQMGNGAQASGPRVSFTYPDVGIYTVTLTVTDDQGLQGFDDLTVDLQEDNEPPEARIEGPFDVVLGEEAEWDSRASEDDVAITSWAWNVGIEGESERFGQLLRYTYDEWENRPYLLTLQVQDTDGVLDIETRSINVLAPPVPGLDGPSEAFVGDEVRMDGTSSFDPDAEEAPGILNWTWDFDDGSELVDGPPFPTHVYTLPGRYDVSVTVRDADGLERTSGTHKVDVYERPNVPPVAVIDADAFAVDECGSITFSGALSQDAEDTLETLRYIWDFGDGASLSGVSASHEYRAAGIYEVTLTVIDSDGAEATDTRFVTVNNLAPTASFAPLDDVQVGTNANFNGAASTDGCDGEIASYQWDFGDGFISGVTSSPVASHTYASVGTYQVTLTVTDNGDPGLQDTYVDRVNVVEAPAGPVTWRLDSGINFSCAFGAVAANLTGFTLEFSGSNATLVSIPTGTQPGTLLGTRTITGFDVSNVLPGACTEEYRIVGRERDDGGYDLTINFGFTGGGGFGGCLDCESVSYTRTAAP